MILTCTLRASMSRSWWCSIVLRSVTPGRSAVRRTMAEKRPNSVSFSASAFSADAKWNNDDTNSGCKHQKQGVKNKCTSLNTCSIPCFMYLINLPWILFTDVSCKAFMADDTSQSLLGCDGGSIDLWNVCILPQHYTASQLRRPRPETPSDGSSMDLWNGGILP
jgi:hypothetical protein